MAFRTYYINNRAYNYNAAFKLINEYYSVREVAARISKDIGLITTVVASGFGVGILSEFAIPKSGVIMGVIAYFGGFLYAFNTHITDPNAYAPSIVSGAELVNAINELNKLSVWSPHYESKKVQIIDKLFTHQYNASPLTIDDNEWNDWPAAVLNAHKSEIYNHNKPHVDVYINDNSPLVQDSNISYLIDDFD